MLLRLMELVVPPDVLEDVEQILSEHSVLDKWTIPIEKHQTLVRILLPAEHTEKISDILSDHFSHEKDFRIMLHSVEATLPKPEEPEQEEQTKIDQSKEENTDRISREELYNDVTEGAKLTTVYLITVILSSLVAAIGLMKDNVAVIIGAMVIAPLLGPNVALSLAATLGDLSLAYQSLKTNIAGLITAIFISCLIGLIMKINPDVSEIASRTSMNFGDILIALAAGSAGVLAYTRGVPAAIIGVMVAVALLPPLVTFGLLAGSGYWHQAFGAFLLTVTNLTAVNLAGVITFLAQGIRPRSWWEEEKAKRAIKIAISFWLILLLILFAVILIQD